MSTGTSAPPPAVESPVEERDPALAPSPSPETAVGQISRRSGLGRYLPFFGPAFVASIAYLDPGNFATNVSAGASHGYVLLWVVLAANLMGMLIQTLSAKLGLATGRNLPELCRDQLPRSTAFGLWLQAELIAFATDLAEIVGSAIALNLLFGVPMFVAGLITAVIAFVILGLQSRGHRRFELAIGAALAVILAGFLYDTLKIGPDWGAAGRGFAPGFDGGDSILLACGILGATVMPHVIYLHSALTQRRIPTFGPSEKRQSLRYLRLDVVAAMSLAGIANMLMLIAAASLFHGSLLANLDTIAGAHAGFERLLGGGAALAFACALLASGLASSSVGTYAGQVIMQGFGFVRISLVLRRLLTMTPALVVLAVGVDPTRALIFSQVALSFGIPFALIPLIWLTSRRRLMGEFVNHRVTTLVGAAMAAAIVALNVFLIGHTLGL